MSIKQDKTARLLSFYTVTLNTTEDILERNAYEAFNNTLYASVLAINNTTRMLGYVKSNSLELAYKEMCTNYLGLLNATTYTVSFKMERNDERIDIDFIRDNDKIIYDFKLKSPIEDIRPAIFTNSS